MLRHLTVAQVHSIIAACDAANTEELAAFADSPHGVRLNDPRVLDRVFNPPEEDRRFVALVEALSPDALVELIALMWTGRADGTYADNRAAAAEDRHGAIYVIDKSGALSDYLRDGLRELGLR